MTQEVMSERNWSLIFTGWGSRERTKYILKTVLISSIILSGFLSVFGFITKSEFRQITLVYTIIFAIQLGMFLIKPSQYILIAFFGTIVLGIPIWMYIKQDPSVIPYIALLLVVCAAVIKKFRYTTLIYAFTLANLVVVIILDLVGAISNVDLPYPLSINALLQLPILTLSYIVALYVNKVLMNSLNTQSKQLDLLKTTQSQLINQEKNKSIQLLAGGIAHDFNNLLTVILGNINLLRLDLMVHPESLELVEEVENAALQARDLTKELLTFSKETVLLTEVVNLSNLLKKTAKFASSGSKTKTVVDISEKLWSIQGNPTQLNQVFQNLILNARQAMQSNLHGGIIHVVAENTQLKQGNKFNIPDGSYVSIRVIDSGKGILPNELVKIFDPYYSTKIGSHGLGLAICHTIIQNHKGSIHVESTPGKETKFEIVIPANIKSTEKYIEKNGDILILEEDIEIIRVLNKNLNRIGFSLDFASNCEEVKLLLKNSVQNGAPYKILIIDTSLSHDGNICEETQMLKAIHKEVKIILSSDVAIHPVIKNYHQHGFDAFLPKPYQIRDIRNLIQSLTLSIST